MTERFLMGNMLERINQSIWELQRTIRERPDDFELRKDLLKFYQESRFLIERRAGVHEEDRSFLLMQQKESLGCLLLHGAGGTPAEMRMLGEHLYNQGYTVCAVRLPISRSTGDTSIGRYIKEGLALRGGKERTLTCHNDSWSICLSEAEVALATLMSFNPCTYLIGFSFGGTIALNLLDKRPVKAAALISPALYPVRHRRYYLFKACRTFLPSVAERIGPREYTVIEFMERTRSEISGVEQPVLVIQSHDDPVVSTRSFNHMKRVAKHENSRFEMLYSKRHVLVTGDTFEKVAALCTEFIRDN